MAWQSLIIYDATQCAIKLQLRAIANVLHDCMPQGSSPHLHPADLPFAEAHISVVGIQPEVPHLHSAPRRNPGYGPVRPASVKSQGQD